MKTLVLVACLVATALGCGDVLEGESGTFTSPNYPNDYSNNLACSWTITVPSGRVRLEFADFSLESTSRNCDYDKVVVREANARGTVLGTFCGASHQAVESSGRSLYVSLETDSSITEKGFSARWSVASSVNPPVTSTQSPPTGGCGGNLVGESGTVSSPGFPNNYDHNLECTWTVSLPAGTIKLNINEMDIEQSSSCSYDYLKVYEGNQLLSTSCGSGSKTIEGSSSSLRLVFKSDSSVNGKGFTATWERLTCESNGLQCVENNAACTGKLVPGLFCENEGVCCEPPFDQGDCGVLPPTPLLIGGKPRIVGGDAADNHEWPWQVSLRTVSTNFHFCGGSIISDRWVVTAAHCVDGDSTATLKITSGEHHKETSSGREQDHAVSKIIMHEAYDGNGAGFPNDIALLKLATPLEIDAYRRPICLAELDDTFYGNPQCYITGWGKTQGTGDENVLNELKVDIWDQSQCSNTWGASYINPGHICLGTGDTGACNGDSGGPLACQINRDGKDRWILAGATSWGRSGCQTAGYPSVYSRISHFREWLLRKIREN